MSHIRAVVEVEGKINILTGLHIGGSKESALIGEKDSPVIREPLSNEPYIPGSSIKGKLRSLLEKSLSLDITKKLGSCKIHTCTRNDQYRDCPVCNLFGVPAEQFSATDEGIFPTRLSCRDAYLDGDSKTRLLENPNLDLPFTHVKTEVVIDRFTSRAMPRDIERLPAGVSFDLSIGAMLYQEKDLRFLPHLFYGLYLLEHDYLGGHGSRGYGRVSVRELKISWNTEGLGNPLSPPTNIHALEGKEPFDIYRALQSDA